MKTKLTWLWTAMPISSILDYRLWVPGCLPQTRIVRALAGKLRWRKIGIGTHAGVGGVRCSDKCALYILFAWNSFKKNRKSNIILLSIYFYLFHISFFECVLWLVTLAFSICPFVLSYNLLNLIAALHKQ